MTRAIVQITHRQEFSASHRLHNPRLPAEENRRLFGVCNNPNGHGHNYEIEVSVRGEVPEETGMVMDLNRLRELVLEKVVRAVDHRHLNHDVDFLQGTIPTAENLAIAFWRLLQPSLEDYPGCRLHRIRVRESRSNFADYLGPSQER